MLGSAGWVPEGIHVGLLHPDLAIRSVGKQGVGTPL